MSLNPGMLLNTNGTIFDLFDALRGASADDFDFRIDWKETPEAHVFRADLPGVKKGDVKVDVEDGRVLHIVAERCAEEEEEEEEKAYKWHCKERAGSRVLRRRFRLPDDAKAEETKASMENGVLTLVVPKGKVKNPEVRAVEIAGGHGKKSGKVGVQVFAYLTSMRQLVHKMSVILGVFKKALYID